MILNNFEFYTGQSVESGNLESGVSWQNYGENVNLQRDTPMYNAKYF